MIQFIFQDGADLVDAIDSMKYRGGNTNTTGGLQQANDDLFTREGGDRPSADNILLLISDGTPTREVEDLIPLANRMKNRKNIRIIGVGVTDQVNLTMFQHIVSRPFESHYFAVDDFDELQNIIEELIDEACRILPTPTPPAVTPKPSPREYIDTREHTWIQSY